MYRILSVEDDPIMQKVLEAALVSAGYEFFSSLDGRSAMPMALSKKPDLILLDVNLPDITGIEVCRALKTEPKTRHIPVVMLTGEAREVAARVKGLDVGAEDYMFKPISPRVLLARIGSILKQLAKPAQH
ncbi:MAG: response regulator [Elusimicrobia bacterium]|nr:response regulator [Elusimicrobiota bacterium]